MSKSVEDALDTPIQLPNDWQEWIADCVMMQVPDDAIVSFMVNQGIEQGLVERSLDDAKRHPYVMAGAKLARQLKRRDWLLRLQQTIIEQSPYRETIEVADSLDKETFYKNYHAQNRPVIMTNALNDWPTLKKWTPEYFKTHYGERTIEIDRVDQVTHRATPMTLTMGEYVDTCYAVGDDPTWYLSNANTPYNKDTIGDLLDDIGRPLPHLLDPEGTNPNGHILFGPAGSITDCHFDLANAIFVQIYGRKRFVVVPPVYLPYMYPGGNIRSYLDFSQPIDYDKFPLAKNLKIYEFIIEPGQAFFLPIGWWHFVTSLEVSISASFSNFYTKEGYRYFLDMFPPHPAIRD